MAGRERVILSYQKMQEVVDGINTDDRSGTGVAVALMTVKAILGDIIYKLEQAELEGNENEKGEVRMDVLQELLESRYEIERLRAENERLHLLVAAYRELKNFMDSFFGEEKARGKNDR